MDSPDLMKVDSGKALSPTTPKKSDTLPRTMKLKRGIMGSFKRSKNTYKNKRGAGEFSDSTKGDDSDIFSDDDNVLKNAKEQSKSQENLTTSTNGPENQSNNKKELVKIKPFKSKSSSTNKIRMPKMFKKKKGSDKETDSDLVKQEASDPDEVLLSDEIQEDADLAMARYEKGRVRRLSQHFTQISKINAVPDSQLIAQLRRDSKTKLDVTQTEITSVASAASSRSSSTSRSEYQSYKTSKSSSVSSSKSQSGTYTFWHQHDPEGEPKDGISPQDDQVPRITAVQYKAIDTEKKHAPSIESLFVPPPEHEPTGPKDFGSRSPSLKHLSPIKYTPSKQSSESTETNNTDLKLPTDDEKIFNYNVSYKSRQSIVKELAQTDLESLLNRNTAVVMKRAPEPPSDAFHMAGHTGSPDRHEHLYKILVIGELGTGKTSIIKRYVHQFFSQHYRATIGVDFALKVLNWDSNTIIRLQLWDIAGQERFGNMTRVYYKEAVGALVVFDVTRAQTFECVSKWKNDLDTKVTLPNGAPIPTVLIANKCDQPKEGVANNPAKMDEFCRDAGFAGWFETSAKENLNIDEAAKFLVNKIMANEKEGFMTTDSNDNEKFSLDGPRKNSGSSQQGSSCKC